MKNISLAGIWSLTRVSDGSVRPMAVPGDIISALLAAGEIPDPYAGTNELDLQWIGREDWRLALDFELDEETMSLPEIFFEAEVVDTVATVFLNGISIACTRNMFRRLRADMKDAAVPGRNRMEILILSPEKDAAKKAACLPYPVPYSEYPVFSPHRNLLRKEQCMAGWDWGPCLMTGGIYDSVSVVAHAGPRIEYICPRYSRNGNTWTMRVALELHSSTPCRASIDAALSRDPSDPAPDSIAGSEPGGRSAESVIVDLPSGTSTTEINMTVRDPELWWPAGFGKQALYSLRVGVTEENTEKAAGHKAEISIGFRELVVVAEEDKIGKSMYLRVNDKNIFAKGANWIPADSLPSRRTHARLESLLNSAVVANMNCLRVWGGGRYESDAFYRLCDKKGIMIWQDCMFSCALYPTDKKFLADVDAEIRHQVKRLLHHPAIALWCGNNEALGAIGWYEESKRNAPRYIIDYDRLCEGVLGKAVRELDPGRTWWPSSPSAGPEDFSDNWHTDGRGDMHYWAVWHEGKPFSAYLDIRPRFCSEFGFQSFPSMRTVRSFADPSDWNITSPVMEHHQRHPRGNFLILDTMTRYYRMPSGFAATLCLSQVQQAMAMKTAVEWWRSLRPECMGTLYWQLNDVWPVSSWSSLEYDGSWKLLHYEARRFFAPLHLALVEKDGLVKAIGMNDSEQPRMGRLSVRIMGFDGETLREWIQTARILAEASVCLWQEKKADLPGDPRTSFIYAEWLPGTGEESGLESEPESEKTKRVAESLCAWMFRTEAKRCILPDSRIKTEISRVSPTKMGITLSSGTCCFHVMPVATDLAGFFSDAGFLLLPGKPVRLTFDAAGLPLADGELESKLEVWHLAASYRQLLH